MTASDTTGEELTKDEVFDVFNNARRRYVLYLLDDAPEGMSISELTDEVAAWEEETPVEELSQQQRKRVYVSLYQTHVVKMDDMGIVDFDRDSGLVTLTPTAERLRQFLPKRRTSRPWPLYYLSFAVVGVVVYASRFLGLLDGIAWAVVAVLVYAGFAFVAVGHYSSTRSSRCRFEDLVTNP